MKARERLIMRLDKYLKVSRLIKRRTLAAEACDKKRVSVNGQVAKSGKQVSVGDIIEIRFGEKRVRAKVMDISETVRKDDAAAMYEIL